MRTRRWDRPTQGWVKINIDAARFEEVQCIGLGAVVWDDQGSFLRARSKWVASLLQPREAEALSLKEAMAWIKELSFRKCVFETDAKQLADACKDVPGESYFHTIVMDCVDFSKHLEQVLIEFTNRSANDVAHRLAWVAYSMSDVKEWINTPPDFIYESLVYDSI